MKKIIFLLVFSFFIVNVYSVSCDDIQFSVDNLDKDDAGCYNQLMFKLYSNNCTDNCFTEFDNFTYSTNVGQNWNFNLVDASKVSNPFITILTKIDCSEDIPSIFSAKLTGQTISCNFEVIFEDEYKAYKQKLDCNKAPNTFWNYSKNSCDEIEIVSQSKNDILIEKNEIKSNKNIISTSSQKTIDTKINNNIKIENNVLIKEKSVPKQKNSKKESSLIQVWLISLILIVILIMSLFLYKNKGKKRGLKGKRKFKK